MRVIYIEENENVQFRVVPVGTPKNNRSWGPLEKRPIFMKFIDAQDVRVDKLLRPQISIMDSKGEVGEILCCSA